MVDAIKLLAHCQGPRFVCQLSDKKRILISKKLRLVNYLSLKSPTISMFFKQCRITWPMVTCVKGHWLENGVSKLCINEWRGFHHRSRRFQGGILESWPSSRQSHGFLCWYKRRYDFGVKTLQLKWNSCLVQLVTWPSSEPLIFVPLFCRHIVHNICRLLEKCISSICRFACWRLTYLCSSHGLLWIFR